jgi:hypothetical protein
VGRVRILHTGLGGLHYSHVYATLPQEGGKRGPDESLADTRIRAGYEDAPQRTSRKAWRAQSISESVWVAIAVTRSLLVP